MHEQRKTNMADINGSVAAFQGASSGGYLNDKPVASTGGGGTGTVTSVDGAAGDLTGGPITAAGTLALANTAVTPAAYTNANITVDAKGRITAAANGSVSASVVAAAVFTQPIIFGPSIPYFQRTVEYPDIATNTLITNGGLVASLNNSRFTVTQTGLYQVRLSLQSFGNSVTIIYVTKNNNGLPAADTIPLNPALVLQLQQMPAQIPASCQIDISLLANDYLEVYAGNQLVVGDYSRANMFSITRLA